MPHLDLILKATIKNADTLTRVYNITFRFCMEDISIYMNFRLRFGSHSQETSLRICKIPWCRRIHRALFGSGALNSPSCLSRVRTIKSSGRILTPGVVRNAKVKGICWRVFWRYSWGTQPLRVFGVNIWRWEGDAVEQQAHRLAKPLCLKGIIFLLHGFSEVFLTATNCQEFPSTPTSHLSPSEAGLLSRWPLTFIFLLISTVFTPV